ncbi:phenylalanine--tRNA ligase, alpha subunit [Neorickettsia helminthoeca str. Oregon]|uniref:Phenylalanine--tRNA ligase alpha subunit n=1 Tax=Neorickettsia helminthoeca str. Oregon TaxID=1286528 RepID=X5H382_9RICK|nr:phenylalanine--tRNA ligase subunit alpha [Neorickettsia helminthoeca]AHX11163.1 phenylalanine--tRNA ligase, alpha subunit [Neorickettsia helminthoeca str. Oregon]
MDLSVLRERFSAKLAEASSAESLRQLRIEYLSRNGLIKQGLASVMKDGVDPAGVQSWNAFLRDASAAITEKQNLVHCVELERRLSAEAIDVTYPARPASLGVEHPLCKVIDSTRRILTALGMEYVEGPEIEDEYHVFDALNTPTHHPSRQMQDSFYLCDPARLLRTHTSSVQIRAMEGSRPPFYIFSLGKVYRNDWDATHTPMFHQVEVLCVDVGINMSHMKYCVSFFLEQLFGSIEVRMRPSYFPFTEPSAEVDIKDKNGNWLEVMGCGMVHPNVLSKVDISPNEYTGFAFGAGLERLTMLRYDIRDLRNLYLNDLRWKVI